MNERYALCRGFSLIELTVVLLLITLIASVAVRETSELAFQTRYEQTKERLEMIKQAILGNPRQIINGQQAISGFVADMGRLPMNLRELIDNSAPFGDCDQNPTNDLDGDGDPSHDLCRPFSRGNCYDSTHAWQAFYDESSCINAAAGNTWNANPANMGVGWRGPYLGVNGSPSDSDTLSDGWGRTAQGYCNPPTANPETIIDSASCPNWTAQANDFNYGWYLNQNVTDNLTILSYGRDQNFGGNETFAEEYPELTSQPVIRKEDWLMDISGGIAVVFRKSEGTHPPVSRCSDSTIHLVGNCSLPNKWIGGCNLEDYYNKTSCVNASGGVWSKCSDGSSVTKAACDAAGKDWYGEGFGCADQSKTTKSTCLEASSTWRACTDGTITSESACVAADETWYGDDIFNGPSFRQKICMKIFYRKTSWGIGSLVSDELTTNDAITMSFDPKLVTVDGQLQNIRFYAFRELTSSAGDPVASSVPAGGVAFGIYKFDGSSCATSSVLFPADRQAPIQVDFHPHTTLPVINW